MDAAGGGAGDRGGHDDHGKRDEEDPERLHGLSIGRTIPWTPLAERLVRAVAPDDHLQQ